MNNRRDFIRKMALGSAGAFFAGNMKASTLFTSADATVPAILGGEKSYKAVKPYWPHWDAKRDEELLLKVMRSGVWSRSKTVTRFEEAWAEMLGVKACLSTVNGTNALIAALVNMEIGLGDEVIVTPYTFIASVQAIMQTGAIPVFVDIDPQSHHIDVSKIEAKITPRTKAIMAVHIMGIPADMNGILPLAKKHKLWVLEDACQAHLAEVNGKKVGGIGDAGCFSFQNSKNLPIGEGGAITSNDESYMERCRSYHNYGFPVKSNPGQLSVGSTLLGTKIRFTEYQAAIGLAQMKTVVEETNQRWENGEYLKSRIKDIPGIVPYHLYPGTTKAVFHLFPFRFRKEQFKGMSRELFMKALNAEGVDCAPGYTPLQTQPFIKQGFENGNYKAYYGTSLKYDDYMAANQCPISDKLCNKESVWIPQFFLLGPQQNIAYIAHAFEKIYANAEKIISKG